ncbi:hypothetical protein EG68_08135 [Paragonimus skrjabini miyazakii]|uniref:Uncharacterized protein n=1 Tax=Paragonimus skrjabini miyazakii TaxID=59628 RepID=A0A8S9YL66_9TREM|nr:hypothetical protein EG68_08135 [Paragonimus skrjabini miyazakii]
MDEHGGKMAGSSQGGGLAGEQCSFRNSLFTCFNWNLGWSDIFRVTTFPHGTNGSGWLRRRSWGFIYARR